MKKLLSVSLLALCAFTLSQEQAHAWVNSRFSIGLNWHHQSANTSYLWGLWRNGQVPGPEAFGVPSGGGAMMPGPMTPMPLFPFTQGHQPPPPPPVAQQTMHRHNPYAAPMSMQTMPNMLAPLHQATSMQQVSAQQSAYNPYFNPYYANQQQMASYLGGPHTPPSVNYHPYYHPNYSQEIPYYWYGAR